MRGQCVSLNVVKGELRKLADAARTAGDSELAMKFEGQIGSMSGQHSRSRSRRGGEGSGERKEWDRCDKITTAMLMSAGAGLTYLAYVNVLPSVIGFIPKTCSGAGDRLKSMFVGIFDPTASCNAKQVQWTSFKNAIWAAVFGTATVAPLGPKVASMLGVDKEGLRAKYNKLYEFNRKHVCPYFEKAAEEVAAGECVEGPEGELKKVVEQGLKDGEGKSDTKKRRRTSKRPRSRRQSAFWEMLHGDAESVSSSRSRSHSRSSKRSNGSSSERRKTAKRARTSSSKSQEKARSHVSEEKPREGDDIRKYFPPKRKLTKAEREDIRTYFESTKKASPKKGGKRATMRHRR